MKTSIKNLTISLLALVWPMTQLSAQNLSTEAVDPLLKGSVERFTSPINSTIHGLAIDGKIQGESLSPDGNYFFIGTNIRNQELKIGVYKTEDCQLLYELTTPHFHCFMTSEYLVLYSSLGIDVYTLSTGELKWSHKIDVLFGNSRLYIGEKPLSVIWRNEEMFVFRSDHHEEVKCTGVSTNTGDTLWSTTRLNGCRFVQKLEDSNFLMRGEKYFIFNTKYASVQHLTIDDEIVSQWFHFGKWNYVADKKYLYCFDDQYFCRWKTPLPNGKKSYTHLYSVGDTIVLINTGGIVKSSKKLVAQSVPYVAAFNASDGQQFWMTELANRKEAFSCIYAADSIAYACSNAKQKLLKISLSDGQLQPMQWNADNCGQFKVLSWGDYYHIDRTTNHFQNAGFGFDCALNMTEDVFRVSADEAPKLIAHGTDVYKSHKTLANGMQYVYSQASKDMWIISADGQPLYRFPKKLRGFYIERNTVLFFTDNDHYGVIRFPEE